MARAALLTYIAAVPAPLYNRDILRLAANIPHVGRLSSPHARAERMSAVCGSRVAVDVVVGPEGRIIELAQEVRACALGQASAALMAAHAIGRGPAELAEARDRLGAFLAGRRDDPGDWPGIEVLTPALPYTARHASIMLPFEAVAEAAAVAARRPAVAG
jgi:NifU-like protein involved in Fe-S cluster formation